MPQLITNGGFFEIMTYQPVVVGSSRGLTCKIYFHASNAAGDAPVGLIQACHPIRFRKSTGNWELFLSSVARDEVLSDGGWFIDAGGSENPVFGMRVDDYKDAGRRFQLQEGVPGGAPGGNGGYGAYESKRLRPAFIDDEPTRSFHTMKIKHEFETAAVSLAGARAGKCLGVISWGYEVDDGGNVQRIRPTVSDQPSENWLGAARAWNAHKQIRIPLPG